MDALLSFISSQNGRIARVVVGIVLIIIGLLVIEGTAGTIVAIIGLVPLAAGGLDYCLLASLLGKPIKGADLRASLSKPRRTKR